MRIAMMGSGGVGGFFGGRLAHAGFDVHFIARGAHFAAMREHGLLIENATEGNIHVRAVKVTDDPATIGPVDLVILSVKLWDTEAAARAIQPLLGEHTGVLSLQNGVIKDDILRRALGDKALAASANAKAAQDITGSGQATNITRVMGGVAYVGTHIARPGVIAQVGTMQRIVLGEYDGSHSARAVFLHEALLRAGVTAELSADVRRSLWEKYVFLVGLSATTASMRVTLGAVRSQPQSRAFLLQVMQEAVAVGRAHGVALPADYAANRLAFADTLPASMNSSMHHDLASGNPLEVNWLSGGVVQLGIEKNIPAPANSAVCGILAVHAAGTRGAAA